MGLSSFPRPTQAAWIIIAGDREIDTSDQAHGTLYERDTSSRHPDRRERRHSLRHRLRLAPSSATSIFLGAVELIGYEADIIYIRPWLDPSHRLQWSSPAIHNWRRQLMRRLPERHGPPPGKRRQGPAPCHRRHRNCDHSTPIPLPGGPSLSRLYATSPASEKAAIWVSGH